MNSTLVLFAYFAMLLSPCFVAQWGDLLSFRWISALARRRRTHRAESFLVSFRQERYAMAVALEATFASSNYEHFAVPRPFLVQKAQQIQTAQKPSTAAQAAAFQEARQRVAARVTQLVVAQKLRNAAEAAEKVVVIPPDVAMPAVEAVALSATHIRPRKPQPVAVREPVIYQPVEREPAYGYAPPVYAPVDHEQVVLAASQESAAPPQPEISEVVAVPAHRGIEAVPPRHQQSDSSGSLEIAA